METWNMYMCAHSHLVFGFPLTKPNEAVLLWSLEAGLASLIPCHAFRIIRKGVLVSFWESNFLLVPCQTDSVLRQARPYPSLNCCVFYGQSSFL